MANTLYNDKKISELPLTTNVADTDWVAVVTTLNGVPLTTAKAAAKTLASQAKLAETLNGHIETGNNKAYTLEQKSAYSYQINKLSIVTASGTCNISLRVNSVLIAPLSSITANNIENVITLITPVLVNANSKVELVISNNNAAKEVAFTLELLRT